MENISYIKDSDETIGRVLNSEMDANAKDLAVDVRNVVFGYKKKVPVLNKLSLRVPKGQIFALLGANGTGKTTLIRSILGRLRYSSGVIRVFGVRPGSKRSDIPGIGVGYMPQELALFEEFTIREILKYYGNLYHMESDELLNRVDNLIEILNLPESSRPISKLSGGQRRRVSIAITMVHRPRLIILDEPTVGVDPLLRLRMWQYLENCCKRYGQTVIITTHYIEEARSAANVAFMASGVILKQENPNQLLLHYNCHTLEEVFLYLCVNHNKNLKNRDKNANEITNNNMSDTTGGNERIIDGNIIEENFGLKYESNENNNNYKQNMIHKRDGINLKRIKTMIWKYFVLTMRRPLYLIVFYIMPLIALTSMKLSIGRKPHHIPVAYYNADPNAKLSQLFLDSIEPYYLSLHEYGDNETAVNSVRDGINTLALIFKQNFSQTFALRLTDLYDMTDDELDASQVKVYADFSDSIVGNNVYNSLLRAFEIFLKHLGPTYGQNLYRYFFPVTIEPAIYGSTDLNLNVFLTPGLMMALAHLLPMIVSAMQIITDRKNSSMERVLVAGVKPMEFFISHTIENVTLITTQVLFSMAIAFIALNMEQLGSYVEVYLFFLLQGLQGMAIGLLVALLLSDEVSVGIGLTGLMLPIWIVSGVIWPIQSIPYYFRYLSDLSPITQPLEALRAVMLRGWTYENPLVLNGYIITTLYTVCISGLNMILFQFYSDKALSLHLY